MLSRRTAFELRGLLIRLALPCDALLGFCIGPPKSRGLAVSGNICTQSRRFDKNQQNGLYFLVLALHFQYFCKLHLASEQIKIIDRENCPISPYHFTKHLFGGCWVPAMMRQDAKPIFISNLVRWIQNLGSPRIRLTEEFFCRRQLILLNKTMRESAG